MIAFWKSGIISTNEFNIGRMLECLIHSETILLPYDAFEADLFFYHNFKGSKKDIFKRYVLDYNKSISKIEKQCVPQKSQQNKGTVDALDSAFFYMTK